ncbi:MAG: hypothetical protein KF729_18000 [Sandaracinaceae bacterium]|nr:hypothetical protein [Sandaracinaceae bacterium]
MDDSSIKPTRRELLAGAVGALGAAWLAACDGDGGGADAGGGGADAGGGTDAGGGGADAGPLECNRIDWMMTNRHPRGLDHSIDVPIAHVMAGTERTYDITGDSRHPHTVVVTAAHFAALARGETVTITSSEDMGVDLHTHDVILVCAA